jgi:hypothetical protein
VEVDADDAVGTQLPRRCLHVPQCCIARTRQRPLVLDCYLTPTRFAAGPARRRRDHGDERPEPTQSRSPKFRIAGPESAVERCKDKC